MRRLAALAVTAALVASCASRRTAQARDDSGAARALEDEYLAARFARYPEEATVLGIPGADDAAVTDQGLEAFAAWQAKEDRFLERARRIDRTALAGTAEGVAMGILVQTLEGERAMRACRPELWPVSSLGGWQSAYAQLAEIQPVNTPEQRRAAVARLAGVAPMVDAIAANLREGMRLGYVATVEDVDRVVGDLDRLLATAPEQWPYVRPGQRAGDPALEAELAGVVKGALLPATRRYRDLLAGEYRARARREPSLLSMPDGERCYRGAVLDMTTLPLEPREIHERGLAEMARLHEEMRKIGERSFGTSDVTALLRRGREDPSLAFESPEQIVSVARAAIERAEQAAPRAFGRVPKAKVVVQPYPEFMRGSNPADSYSPSHATGALQGIYFINPFDPKKKPRAHAESTAFHEAVPGHHFQIALALERAGGPRIGKYVVSSGYVEGWALYAEGLAAEMGLYSSDLYRLGQLESEAFRAARLVVDPGLAVLGWSRQRAVDYLVDKAGLPPGFAASEVDRYCAWPGQATAYMTGALEIRRLRAEAQKALGPGFDLRAFHDAVLEDGAVSLPLLRERIARFVEERRRAATAR